MNFIPRSDYFVHVCKSCVESWQNVTPPPSVLAGQKNCFLVGIFFPKIQNLALEVHHFGGIQGQNCNFKQLPYISYLENVQPPALPTFLTHDVAGECK